MTDLEIKYPSDLDLLPFTTTVSVSIGDTMNAFRESILNIETVLGLNVNIGLFTPDPLGATVADRLNRIERGISERNLVFKEINVSDAVQVYLDKNNKPFVNIGLGTTTDVAPVTILGPLTILAPALADPRTIVQTPVSIDVTTFDENKSASTLIKGKANELEPILRIHDTSDGYETNALHVIGNMKVEGILEAEYSIDHNKVLNTGTIPTDATRGDIKHVTQGDFHTHRKGRYDLDKKQWIVDSSTSVDDNGIIKHSDLENIGTLPTDGNDFTPIPGIAYHVTGGDNHNHSAGDGAQIQHDSLYGINPNSSNHVAGGNTHAHTADGDGGTISHTDLSDIETLGNGALHVTSGDAHTHDPDLGDGAVISHNHLVDADPSESNHVTSGDSHTHSGEAGDGGSLIDHTSLLSKGELTHDEIDAKIDTFRAIVTGTASFTSSTFDGIEIPHNLGTDQFNVSWSLAGNTFAPPSDPADVGTIYVTDKTSSTFKLARLGGAIAGPAEHAVLSIPLTGSDNDLYAIARTGGTVGNDISFGITEDGGVGVTEISVETSFSQIDVKINPATDRTALDVIEAVKDHSAASLMINLYQTEGDGTGVVDGYAITNLAGGTDTSGFNTMEVEWIVVATI